MKDPEISTGAKHSVSGGNKPAAGFTLVEVIISTTIGSMVLIGILSSFLMLTRSGHRVYFYNGMEAESRRTLEEFAQDVRMASNSTLTDSCTLTLTVPGNYNAFGHQVTYAYGSVTIGSVTYDECFYRRPGDTTSTATPTILIRNVKTCAITGYDVNGASTTVDLSTKRIELSLFVSQTGTTLAAATNNIISATYLLRNK